MNMNSDTLQMRPAGFFGSCKKMKRGAVAGATLGAIVFLGFSVANATYIRGAVSAESMLGDQGTGFSVANVINQSGLSGGGYSNGDDFNGYVDSATHQWQPNTEWWTPWDTYMGSVVFDLGGLFTLDKVALWNEDDGGLSALTISVSQNVFDNSNFGTVVGIFSPTDNLYNSPDSIDYGADIFTFSPKEYVRYVRFDMTAAVTESQKNVDPNNQYPTTISMGEVAFSVAEPVPEPATILLFSVGLAGLLGVSRRKR